MKAIDAIRTIMNESSVRPATLCSRLNIKASALSQRFQQKTISVNKLSEMARVMDYKVVIVPCDAKLPKGSYEVE